MTAEGKRAKKKEMCAHVCSTRVRAGGRPSLSFSITVSLGSLLQRHLARETSFAQHRASISH